MRKLQLLDPVQYQFASSLDGSAQGSAMQSNAIRDGTEGDGPACGAIVNRWIDETDWMPRVHTTNSVVEYFTSTVLAKKRCWVVEQDAALCGFLALDLSDGLVTALYLDGRVRGQGLGAAMLNCAKVERPAGLGGQSL